MQIITLKFKKTLRTLRYLKRFGLELDQSKNIYKISPSNYHRIQQNKNTNTYKLDNIDTLSQINNDTARFSSNLHINDRRGKLEKKVLIFES